MNTFKITIREGNGGSWSVETELTRANDRLPVHCQGKLNLSQKDIIQLNSLTLQRQQYGQLLGKALFQEKIYEAYLQAIDSSSKEGMRVLLTVEDKTLETLYWHWLCAPRDWNPISLKQSYCFSIGIKSSTERVFPPIKQQDLKALILVANPQDLEKYNLASFDAQITVKYLKTALGEIPTDVLAIEGGGGKPTLDQLCDRLTRFSYTILHIVGHGWVNKQRETVLYWTTEDNQVAPIEASHLIQRLEKITQLPRFVFLCVCESAKIEAGMALGGLAQRMVRELGIPAVLAMTEKVTIETAKSLSKAFYPRLRKHGEVDKALVEATSSLSGHDILVPALFSRLGGSSLFDNHIILLSDQKIKQRELKKNSPYKGLKKFNFKDRKYFFGRDFLIDKLFMAVNQSSFTLVLGASGSGKSSVVRAGVIPELKESIESSQRKFYDFIFTPNQDPFDSFYRCLLNEEKDYSFRASQLEIVLNSQPETLLDTINALKKNDEYWLLFIDQFEQIFTSCTDLTKRTNFIEGIIEVAKTGESSVKIVLAMRSDFLEQFSFYPTLSAIANQNNIHLVAEMYPDELQQAISQPAAQHGVVFEEGLVEQIIKDVEGQRGCLPLLQYTLDLLWETECKILGSDGCPHIEDRTLNKSSYTALEGVRGALQKRVHEIYKNVCQEYHEGELITKQIFLKLVDIVESDSGSKAVSRRADRNEFEKTENTLKRFIDENLVVSSYDCSEEKLQVGDGTIQMQNSTVEIAHEILLSSWKQLKLWLEEYKEAIILKNWLAGETKRWKKIRSQDESKAREEFLKGSRLEQVIEFRNKDYFQKIGSLTAEENGFIELSIEWRDTQAKIERERKIKELEAEVALNTQQEKNKILNQALNKATVTICGGLMVLSITLVATIAVFMQLEEAQKATRLEQAATSARQQFQADQLEALLLAMRSGQELKTLVKDRHLKDYPTISPVFTLQKILDSIYEQNQLNAEQGEIKNVRFSPDGQQIAMVGEDNTVKLWNKSGKFFKNLDTQMESVNHFSFNPKGKQQIATAGNKGFDGVVQLWDSSGQKLKEWIAHKEGGVNYFSFNQSGDKIATAGGDGMIRLWNLSAQKLKEWKAVNQESAGVRSIAISSKEQIASAADDGFLRLWDLSGKKLAEWKASQNKSILSISFSPDGNHIAMVDKDNTPILWNLSGKQIALFKGHQKYITSISFSPDGQRIVTIGEDGTARIWDLSGKEIAQLRGHGGAIKSASFSPDSQHLITGGKDATLRLWKLGDKPVVSFQKTPEDLNDISFNPTNKQQFATVGEDGMIRLWNLSGKQERQFKINSPAPLTSVSFSGDGQRLVVSGKTNRIRMWSVSGESIPPSLEETPVGLAIQSVSFSSDGQYIATGASNGALTLWTVSGQKKFKRTEHKDQIWEVKFSPKGNLLATAGVDGTVKLWNLAGQKQTELLGHQGKVNLSFSSDSQQIVTTSEDSMVHLWDIAGQEKFNFFTYQRLITSVSCSPDGQLIATADRDGIVRIWDKLGRQVFEFQGNGTPFLSLSFSLDGQYLATAAKGGKGYLWRIDNLDALLERGCKWLHDYFDTHPDKTKEVAKACLNK
jgi:WD40 repeat protein/energy-coupling factor transporter ATP-binding protein EcfA2